MLNHYSEGLCNFCFQPGTNRAGSTCKFCSTSFPQEPKKSNYKKWPTKETTINDQQEINENENHSATN